MAEERVDCKNLIVPDALRMGSFANAFRIVKEAGGEYFLDFLQYSASEELALVVARVRVQGQFLSAIHSRLASTIEEAQTPAGIVVLLGEVN